MTTPSNTRECFMQFAVDTTDGLARRGRLKFPRGDVETPAFMPVGTYGTVKGMLPRDIEAIGAEIVLGNTFHLMLRPGTEVIKAQKKSDGSDVTNLLDNAWKYTAKKDGAEIIFSQKKLNGERIYVVEDNGAGFDMEYANNLFTPFTRLHKVSDFRGIGIGLATVKRVAARHGGRVWAESSVGKGAKFFFTLKAKNHA
jgi:light-regulated signal transduction histidine kinase (bacteriophytochrome)